jgi:hypothetical protein
MPQFGCEISLALSSSDGKSRLRPSFKISRRFESYNFHLYIHCTYNINKRPVLTISHTDEFRILIAV